MLRENIDGLTQKIRYFEHLIMNHVKSENQFPNKCSDATMNKALIAQRRMDDANTVSIVTPFVVKEALRIKEENEKDLNDLRARLDELRKNRNC